MLQQENSDLAKSLSDKSNNAIYQDENPYRGLLPLQNTKTTIFPIFSGLNTGN